MAVNLMDRNMGISGVMPQLNVDQPHLPDASRFVTGEVDNQAGLDTLFGRNEQDKQMHAMLAPQIKNPRQLDPSHISLTLSEVSDKLSTIHDKDVRSFVRRDVQPMMENRELLRAYLGMMVEG